MSEPTIADIQTEIAALRREIGELRARQTPPARTEQPDAADDLRQRLAEKDALNGISVGHRITQIRGDGGSGTASYSVSIDAAADLPTDEQIAEKVARLAPLVQNPLVLRALRDLARPHFEGKDKRRSKSDLAASLGVGEAEVEAAMTPLLDRYEVTWGKDASGQEYYEWTGNTLAMTLLILG
jgi:hypothetical protein